MNAPRLNFLSDSEDPCSVWPGFAALDRSGVAFAVKMFGELEKQTEDGIEVSDMCCLENWPREGLPFRNIVGEYIERARRAGAAAEYAFTAVLSDLIALHVLGIDRALDCYARQYGIADQPGS
jgi:hypothetical protein